MKIPKDIFDAMKNMYKDDLDNVKVQCQKTFKDYFTRIYHLKDQIETIEDNVKEAEA